MLSKNNVKIFALKHLQFLKYNKMKYFRLHLSYEVNPSYLLVRCCLPQWWWWTRCPDLHARLVILLSWWGYLIIITNHDMTLCQCSLKVWGRAVVADAWYIWPTTSPSLMVFSLLLYLLTRRCPPWTQHLSDRHPVWMFKPADGVGPQGRAA